MLNLSEEWKKAYAEYLIEDSQKLNSDIDKLFVELSEAHDEVKKGFTLVENYFELYNLLELNDAPVAVYDVFGTNLDGNDKNNRKNNQENNRNKNFNDQDKKQGNLNPTTIFKDLINQGFVDPDGKGYTPTATYTVKNISDMKFPSNIIFFLKQLIVWAKNIVLYFIEAFKNHIRRLLGDYDSVTKIDMDKLKFNTTQAKKIDAVSTTFKVGKDYSNKPFSVKEIDSANVELLEGLTDQILLKKEPKELPTKKIVVTLDLSKDIESLKLLIQHFYDLFSGAFGTFNEKLFETDDLELILKLFDNTISNILSGEPSREMSVNGSVVELQAINPSRVKENLIKTNENVTKLKDAYVQTSAKIKDIAKIINSKELLAMSDFGVSYQMLTSATLAQLMPIMKSMPIRLKEASDMERKLNKVKQQYDELVKRLSNLQKSFMSVSNIAYTTVYARRLNELFIASRYMTDVVTLRLSPLGLYIKELKDIKDIMKQLNGFTRSLK